MIQKCRMTGEGFAVTDAESSLRERLGVPSATLCPEERARTRLAWRNERLLYRRKCDATAKPIISIFDSNTPFPVYSQEHWWSDAWDALSFGREFDFSRPFFPQFADLFSVVPQCALRCPQSENSEYTNQCENNKDCYMLFCSSRSRSCMHGMWNQQCIDCVDCTYVEQCELCYEVLNAKESYHCANCDNLQNCHDCYFCRDLIGCHDCVGCVNLRNESHCFFNERLSPERYAAEITKVQLNSRSGREKLRERFAAFSAGAPFKFYSGKNNEGFSGDYLENNKNVFECFNCRNCENVTHGRDAWNGRNSLDLTETLEQDFCIELEGCFKNVRCGFSSKISETHETWYSSHCFNSSDLFGCVGLRQKHYCILNRQYSKDDYLALREKIVAHMEQTEEWGEFFPRELSPFAYNESVAQEYFPLSESEALSLGLRWKEPERGDASGASPKLRERIDDVDDSIVSQTFLCSVSGRPFKIQRPELKFYRKMDVPLTAIHPEVRHAARMNRRNPRQLQEIACAGCGEMIQSTFVTGAGMHILCESCYNAVVR